MPERFIKGRKTNLKYWQTSWVYNKMYPIPIHDINYEKCVRED